MDLHLATHGDDAAVGTVVAPLATLAGAWARLCFLHQADALGDQAVTVWLHGGTYRLERGFRLEAAQALPVSLAFRACPGESVQLSGARRLPADGFRPVDDPAVSARLDPAARGQVVQLDLAALGLHQPGPLRARGFGHREQPADAELFIDNRPMPVSRWPKNGSMEIGAVADPGSLLSDSNGRGAIFACGEARLARWTQARHAVCHGSWAYDWAPSTVPITSVDAASGSIHLATPTQYGVRSGKHVTVMHLLEEIGAPGEWYIDHDAGTLYLWPPHPLAGADIELSHLDEPLISVIGQRRVSFHGLVIAGGRGAGVVLEGSGNRVVGCELRNLGGHAVRVGGEDNGVVGCHVHDCGQGGLVIAGGDRRSLTPAGNFADNNHIHACNRVVRTYAPGIAIGGVGQRVTRNLIHDLPHFAIRLHGNDHRIEGNEICDVCIDCDDAGAIYTGRDPSERGSVIRGNFFHHVGTGRDGGTAAIYIDDGSGGILVEDNVFFRTGNRGTLGMGAICINNGKDTRIERNIFCECPRAVGVLLTTQESWQQAMGDVDPGGDEMRASYRQRMYRDVDITRPPYATRYPELARLPLDASRNRIAYNVVDRCDAFVLGLERQDAEGNRLVDADPGYRDALHLDLSLPGHAPVGGMGLDAALHPFPMPDLRRRLDLRLRLDGRPQQRAGDADAHGRVTLFVVNRSDHQVQTEVELSAEPASLQTDEPAALVIDLAPGAACERTVAFRVTTLNHRELHLSVRDRRTRAVLAFAQAFVQVDSQLRLLPSGEVHLDDVPVLPFLDDAGRTVGRLRLARCDDALLIRAEVDDPRAVAPGPWRTVADPWQGPMFGLFFDTVEPSCVRQLVFFPRGPDGDELWHLAGPERRPAPALSWRATVTASGYTIEAAIPLSGIDLAACGDELRLQGMINIPGSRVLPLFGASTSYNDSTRFAIFATNR